MASLEIHPLSGLRDEAATLLAERYARQRTAEPLLPHVEDFEPHLPDEGHVATRDGQAVAYLGGAVDGETEIARWLFAGHAAREPEALRDLFALQAAEFGVSRFMLTVPAADQALVDVWFRLAFGCQAVWAVREVAPPEPVEFGGTIRPATPDDTEAGIDFDEILYAHQAETPSFSGFATPPREQLRTEWAEVWNDTEPFVPFVAERDGRVVGLLGLYRRPEGDLRVPENNIDLAFAATRGDVRGTGAGLALTAHALEWAHARGFTSMTVDWRSVNLLSSRFWPRRGFRPQYLRLYRAVP
ncbi:MAG TPA: GNAT family N-acetyltransferase [Gaiellaceae bacterium]|jgi:GNAT superfamily N-acetyltransferase|nr:GNAT family N-acetyltransferase [Gaiellaceae bacterium]